MPLGQAPFQQHVVFLGELNAVVKAISECIGVVDPYGGVYGSYPSWEICVDASEWSRMLRRRGSELANDVIT